MTLKRSQFLNIPINLPSLNQSNNAARTHWSKAHRQKRQWTEMVAWECIKQELETVRGPAFIEFEWREKDARRDPDNISASKKFILDGLVEAHVLPNDNQKWIAGFIESWEVDKENPGVMVTINEKITDTGGEDE